MRISSRFLGAMAALVGIGGLAAIAPAQDSVQPVDDGFTETVTMPVPYMFDDTGAMQARDALFEQPAGLRVVPNYFYRNFQGRNGPRFQGQKDIIDELFGPGGYFPGPPESGLTPGDPDVAVGPNHVIAVINGLMRFYTKAGSQTFSVNPSSFFSGLGISLGLVFDPRCFYDQYAGRWWVLYDAFNSSQTRTYFLIALSDDSDPNGTWSKWAIDSSLDGSTFNNKWSDYPGFGYDQDVIMATANMFPISGSGVYGKIRMMAKSQFLAGSSTISWTDWWNFTNPSGGTAYSLQPARHLGSSNMPYIANVSSSRCNVYGIQNPLTSPTLVKRAATVSSFGAASGGVQKGTSTRWDTLDDRIYDVVCRDNQVLITHNVSGGGGCQARWYHVNAATMPTSISMIQNGNIAGASGEYVGYAALQMNSAGTIGTGVTKSSSNEYISLYYTGRTTGDTPGTMRPLTLQMAGTRSYTGEGGNTVRWGDYIGGALDPSDDYTFWAIGMLPGSSAGAWKTEIYSYTIGSPPATLSGQITLLHYGNPTGLTATLEFRNPGTTTVVHSYPITLTSPLGAYDAGNVEPGTWDVAVKFSHWLREVVPNVTIVSGANGVDMTCVNGDANPDNSVDILDVNQVLATFGTANSQTDLDGSGSVDLPDLNITLTNFGMTGDS